MTLSTVLQMVLA
ncbi:Protein of unknown function [Bacillus cereus]|uniref:Uncharacterized protein n=2 Tax=Bacillus cereus group TaxID=86661 RepID=A0AB37YJ99_9BACI|nr:Protein of unknown function [Bacillus mycoides]SCB80825.1 Protein of unknown function [Bacillus wiedmannii]SCB81867.1 Protein of unknown function [Bacillus mobilis]SCB84274.1 Protein of unknown function [Bacillus cereus]SCL82750.1 Protein of unknown function [Bacillus wiedmannii]